VAMSFLVAEKLEKEAEQLWKAGVKRGKKG
jgi:hypothetical protein